MPRTVRTKPSGLEPHQLEAWRVLLRMRRALDRELDAHLAGHGDLTEADYEVLRPLFEAPGQELRAGAIAAAIEWDTSRLSHRLRQMERRGLVYRRPSRRDLRGSVVGLTDAGRDAYVQVRDAHAAWTHDHFAAVLDDAELSELTSMAERILDRLETTRAAREGRASDEL